MSAKVQGVPSLGRWETLEASPVDDYRIFGVQRMQRRSPRTGAPGTYQVLRMPSWANVVALTPEGEVVLVEQYRHGTDAVTFEIPGGCIEAGEDAARGAARELREETGYVGSDPILLGTVHPNPAIQDNVCTIWLIREARCTAPLELDPGEHIEVHTVSRHEIGQMLRDGRITHALVVAAFYWLEHWEAEQIVRTSAE
jgi:ADP-ribose pyrophosphatase